jgi:recombination protein RecT
MSLIGSIIEASQLGLSLDTNLGEAALVPFAKKIQLIIGYRGFIKLALNSGDCSKVEAHVVYSKDKFNYAYGTDEFLHHKPSQEEDRGDFLGAYAIVQKKDRTRQFHFMTAREIEAIREKAPGYSHPSSAHQTHPDEMRRKTPARNLMKYMNLSPEVQKAATLDMLHETGIDQHSEDVLGGDMQTLTEQRTEDLKETLKEQGEAEELFVAAEGEHEEALLVDKLLKKEGIEREKFTAFMRKTAGVKGKGPIPDEVYNQVVAMLQNEPDVLAKTIAKEIKDEPPKQQELT